MKNFDFRSYSSKLFRPQPVISQDLEKSILVIATPWGQKNAAEKTTELIHNFYLSSIEDLEATSPYEFIFSLSKEANLLRTSVLLANEKVFQEENFDEYSSACEVIAVTKVGNEVHLIQVGQPSLYLHRKGFAVQPLACSLDLSMNISHNQDLASPLPSKLIGLEKNIDIAVHTFIPQQRDRLIFLSRTFAPETFFNLKNTDFTMVDLTRSIAKENTANPFWLAILEF